MASTRNKSTASDYQQWQLQNVHYEQQCVYLGTSARHPGYGIVGAGQVHGKFLSHNSVDIESDLLGIVSNLVEKRSKVVPKLKSLPSLAISQSPSQHVIYPAPLVVDKNNRPFYS
jgi:hypothetical protein